MDQERLDGGYVSLNRGVKGASLRKGWLGKLEGSKGLSQESMSERNGLCEARR